MRGNMHSMQSMVFRRDADMHSAY